MACKLLQTLIPLLALLLLATANTARSQATNFAYDFYGQKPTDLLYQGDAHFPSDSTFLRMTNTDSSGTPLSHRAGRVVYSKPVQFWQDGAHADVETTVKFIITHKGSDSVPGDGLTFFIQPVGSPVGFTGASFGIFNTAGQNPSVFAVEFDIYPNAEVDPSYRHVGIDIGSNVSKNTTDVGSALLGQEVTARINYQQATKLITVHVSAGSDRFEVSYVHDLSTVLPQTVEVGLSGSTGGAIAVHDVVAWYFTSILVNTGTAGRGSEAGHIRQYV